MAARRLAVIALLTVAAVVANLRSPTIFFDNQILLGSSLGVFALLRYGLIGLPVGLGAALATLPLWGHPWAALPLILQLLWQELFLRRFNGGAEQRGNGRIVVATIVFWVVVGLPLKTLLYLGLLQGSLAGVLVIGFKEAVVGVVNAALGLLMYLALRLRRAGRHGGDVPLRGLVFATLMLMISLPGVLIITAMGQQITAQAMGQFQDRLEQRALSLALLLPAGSGGRPADPAIRRRFPGLAFSAVTADGRRQISDPILFAELRGRYRPDPSLPLKGQELSLLVDPAEPSVMRRHRQGYWRLKMPVPAGVASPWRTITLVEPAAAQVDQLISLMRPSLQLLALLLIASALISEALTTWLTAQFRAVVGSLAPTAEGPSGQAPRGPMPALQHTRIRELNRMITRINHQGRIVNQLALDLQQSHERLRQSEQQHRLLADNALDVITICNPAGRPTYISPSIESVRGWSVAEAMALPMDRQLTPEGAAFIQAALRQTEEALHSGLPLPSFRVELQQSHRNGSWIWTDVTGSCIVDETGRYVGTLLVYRDISERKRLERELQERASIDEVTGLLNRRELLERLEALLRSSERRRRGEELALIFVDLDHFKEINDNLGHAAGDTVLRTVAERLRRGLRTDDLAGRLGGDEMVVALRGSADLEAAGSVADTIAASIRQPIVAQGLQVTATASLGVTMARPGESLDDLMARADIAMYQAKQSGRDRIVRIP